MYEKTIEFSKTFNVFEPGDVVVPLKGSPLPPGAHTVVSCKEPVDQNDSVIVFVEVKSRGFNGANLMLSE